MNQINQTVSKTEKQNELLAGTLGQNNYEKVSEGAECIVQYVRKLKGSEHILFLWEREENRDMIVRELFNAQYKGESNALFSVAPRDIPLVKNVTYGDFYHTHKEEFLDKAVDKVSRAVSMNQGERALGLPLKTIPGLWLKGWRRKFSARRRCLEGR